MKPGLLCLRLTPLAALEKQMLSIKSKCLLQAVYEHHLLKKSSWLCAFCLIYLDP